MITSQNTNQNTNQNTQQRSYKQSPIAAVLHVSESEIILAYPNYRDGWDVDFPKKFNSVLHYMGLDSSQDFIKQEDITHRNRMSKIVKCHRWYGNERSDDEWLSSGCASRSALDKAKNNPIVDDSYRQRNETTDAQYTLEQRDRYNVVQD